MSRTIEDPTLLSCSRVNVLDVRPVIKQGQKPLDSIRNSLMSLSDQSSLLVVVPYEPQALKEYVRSSDFSFRYDPVTSSMHWMAIHPGSPRMTLEVSGPGPSYVLPAGRRGHVSYLDGRTLDFSESIRWIRSTLSGLGRNDLMVVYRKQWEEKIRAQLNDGAIRRKSITNQHVRIEISPDPSGTDP